MFSALVRLVASGCREGVPNTEVRLTFAKSGYMMGKVFQLSGSMIWNNVSSLRKQNVTKNFIKCLPRTVLCLSVEKRDSSFRQWKTW